MATSRPKRSNAGNKMSKLIEEQAEDEEDDEFYKTTYGGFEEAEDDQDYQEEDAEEDVVDSDFSLSEEDDDGEGSEDEKEKRPKKKKKVVTVKAKPKTSTSDASKPRKPAVKRILEPVQPLDKRERMRASTVLKGEKTAVKKEPMKRHPKMPQMRRLTQEELLAEAQITQEKNLASLAQFLKLEEEKKKNKMAKVRYQGPVIRFQSFRMPLIEETNNESIKNEHETFCSRNFLEFTDTKNFPKDYFPTSRVKYPEKPVCVVTGHPAKYKDPLTGLPYATIEAFKYIRQHRKRIKEQMIIKHGKRKRKRDLVTAS